MIQNTHSSMKMPAKMHANSQKASTNAVYLQNILHTSFVFRLAGCTTGMLSGGSSIICFLSSLAPIANSAEQQIWNIQSILIEIKIQLRCGMIAWQLINLNLKILVSFTLRASVCFVCLLYNKNRYVVWVASRIIHTKYRYSWRWTLNALVYCEIIITFCFVCSKYAKVLRCSNVNATLRRYCRY